MPHERSGYAPWDFMGTCRHEQIAARLWHNCNEPQDYAALAAQWGLPYTAADFADPNMGEGIGEAQRALSMAGAGLPALLTNLGESLVGAEIGVWRGATARHLLRCPRVAKLYGIDPFLAYDDWWAHIGQDVLDAHRAEVVRDLGAHPRFELLQTTSGEAAKQLGTLDFVFIDGNHAGPQVRRDLENYWLRLRPGGLLSGHDYRTLPAVKEAVDAFAKKVRATISETTNDVWYFYKPQITMPRVVVYTVAHNEAIMLPFFARHYAWAEKIVVFDDESTDGTREALCGFPNVEIRYVNGGGVLDNGFLLRVKNNCWKECRGKELDWVIVVDSDEFAWSTNIGETLRAASGEGATVLRPAHGFSMVGEFVPDGSASLPETIRRGVCSPGYAKPCIFMPDKIEEINFSPGCHEAAPTGEVQVKVDDTLTMLHYVYLSADFHVERGRIRGERRSAANIARGWGRHHAQSDDENREEHARALKDAVWVIGEPE